jgi:glycosyltransferase involved in cell wall biosynthesis
MKIHFDNCNMSVPTGPNTFARRLAMALIESGHDVGEGDGSDADVSLVFIERSGNPLAKRVVHRLDGIWFKPDEFNGGKNARIKQTYDVADAVVWQSEFNRAQITKWWGPPNTGIVVHNGIKLEPETQLVIPVLAEIRNLYDKVFVCSSNWHPQKRLATNIELFLHLREKFYPDSCLIIMGNNPDAIIPSPNIFYTGGLSEKECAQTYAIANWMIHLAWLDHCPNVVIEALSQGTPVICSNDGGTKELVKDFGVTLNEAQPYELTLEDYDNPPVIDVTQVSSPLPDKNLLGQHADIDITNVSKKYVELFESIL